MMRRLKRLCPRIPRPAKAIFCTFCAIALAILYYIALSSPPLSFEQEFRRADKANLVGPSRIVDGMEENCSDFEQMIVGETEHGVCFFGRREITVHRGSNYEREEMMYTFSYREKTGDITVLAAPSRSISILGFPPIYLPVYVFDCYPEAVRAELELTITGTDTHISNGETITTNFSEHFRVEAERTGDDFFRFLLDAQDTPRIYALRLLSDLSGNEMFNTNKNIDVVVPGVVRLYDQSGNLILEKEFAIRSAIAAAHQ